MLLQAIQHHYPAASTVLFGEDCQLDVDEVVKWVQSFRVRNSGIEGKSVGICAEKSIDTILLMVALSGFASSVTLIPREFRLDDLGGRGLPGCIFRDVILEREYVEGMSQKLSQGSCLTVWRIATSGTTGIPKFAEHTLDSLTRVTKKSISGRKFCWGLVYRPDRFAGLQVVLQALSSGNSLVVSCGSQDVVSDVQLFSKYQVNAISATPTYWRKLCFSGLLDRLDLKSVTLGGEPVDQGILTALCQKFPTALVRHIYASTEVGVGLVVKDGLEGFPLEYLDENPSGVKLKVCEASGELLVSFDSKSFLATGDLVKKENDRVIFLGRKSGLINVGGNKVVPEKVEKVLRQISGVHEARVFKKESSIVGGLVAAEVVAKSDLSKKMIVEYCSSKLDKFEVPRVIRFCASLDLGETGKISRK